jgi:hypothetical protein
MFCYRAPGYVAPGGGKNQPVTSLYGSVILISVQLVDGIKNVMYIIIKRKYMAWGFKHCRILHFLSHKV